MREAIKSCEAELKSTVNSFQEKMVASIANTKDDRKYTTSCQEKTEACIEYEELTLGDTKACQWTTTCHEAM
jgi:hypothetical protein